MCYKKMTLFDLKNSAIPVNLAQPMFKLFVDKLTKRSVMTLLKLPILVKSYLSTAWLLLYQALTAYDKNHLLQSIQLKKPF